MRNVTVTVASTRRREGICLDHQKMTHNPGLRKTAKLCLNSLWAKWGEKDVKRKHVLIKSLRNFMATVDKTQIKSSKTSPSSMPTRFWSNTEKASTNSKSNIFIAVFTTCWARLKLYEVLEKTGRRYLYYDTDSVIYKRDVREEPPVQLGHHLGDLTSELDEGDHIVEFASTGPKSYAFRTKMGRNICKVKGCTLNYRNSGKLNFKTLNNFVLGL